MLEIDTMAYLMRTSPSDVQRLVEDIAGLGKKDPHKAMDQLVKTIGVQPSSVVHPGHMLEALNYQLGIVEAYRRRPLPMAEMMRASHSWPGPGGDLLFSDHVEESRRLHEQQLRAIDRGIPPMWISCMPRAASAAVTQTLSTMLDVPLMRLSVGLYPDYYLVPSWIETFMEGGAMLHDHFGANDFNRRMMREAGIHSIHVLIRDPRAAAFSSRILEADDPSVVERRTLRIMRDTYVPWLINWLDAADSGALDVKWLRSSDMTRSSESLTEQLSALLEFFGLSLPSKPIQISSANFKTGKNDAFRAAVSAEGQKMMWDMIPHQIRDMLELEP